MGLEVVVLYGGMPVNWVSVEHWTPPPPPGPPPPGRPPPLGGCATADTMYVAVVIILGRVRAIFPATGYM